MKALVTHQKELFLDALARSGNVTQAARIAGWRYPTIAEEFKKEDPQFALAWSDAVRQANDALIYEARRRAIEGVQKPVFYLGQQCGSITEYSDKLLDTLLKAEMPEKFRDSQRSDVEESGVLLVPRSAPERDITDWEADATAQQKKLLSRTE